MTYYTVVTLSKNGRFFDESFPLTTTDKKAAFKEKAVRVKNSYSNNTNLRVIVITSEALDV